MTSPVKIILAAAALTLTLWQPPAFGSPGRQCPPGNPNCIPKRRREPKPPTVRKQKQTPKTHSPVRSVHVTPTPPAEPPLSLRWRLLTPRPPRQKVFTLEDVLRWEGDSNLSRGQRPAVSLDEARTPHAQEVSATSTFSAGQRLQLGVTVSQRGYLYAFSQKQGQSGTLIHAGLLTDRLLDPKTEYLLPSDCGPATPAQDCWYTMPAEKSNVFFTVIFSRKKLGNLSERIRQASRFTFDLSRGGDLAAQINSARGLQVSHRRSDKSVSVMSAHQRADELVVTVLLTPRPAP